MKLLITLIFTITFVSNYFHASEEHSESCSNKNVPNMERNFSNTFDGTFNGKKIEYEASLKEKILREAKRLHSTEERARAYDQRHQFRKAACTHAPRSKETYRV